MKNIFRLFLIFSIVLMPAIALAEDSVSLPCKKPKSWHGSLVVKDETYDSNGGFDFTGKGKPRYYDPMYYNYYTNEPMYDLFYNYPIFYMPPVVRGRGK